MSNMLSWLKKKTGRLLDPQREARVRAGADVIREAISRDREHFDLQRSVVGLNLFPEDIGEACEEAYKRFVAVGVADGILSDRERTTLAWIAKRLGIEEARARILRYDARRQVFIQRWACYLKEEQLSATGLGRLRQLVRAFAIQPSDFVEASVAGEIMRTLNEAFTRRQAAFRQDNDLWANFTAAAELVGVRGVILQKELSGLASSAIGEAMTNATADGDVSADEVAHIRFLMDSFGFDPQKRAGVEATISRVNLLRDIVKGRLPSLNVHHIGLRAGEIVHAYLSARYHKPRRRQGQVQYEPFEGTLLITDNRLLFAGMQSFELPHRRVQGIHPRRDGFDLVSSGKGAGIYVVPDPPLYLSIFQSAVKRANQTLVAGYDPIVARHIPRDVRQRVWQRYGGRCADCGDDRYLEFDHVVPVAKGGSNSDANVQLLCRACNGKKSDRI